MCGRRLQQPGAVRRGQRTTTGTVQAKVLLAWRKATSCVKPSPAVSRAPSRMDKVRQQGTFRRWRERSRAVVEESTGMEKTKRHHSLLCSMFRLWTMYRQHQQSYKLQHRRRAAEQTELALWHWSLSLQAKVLEAVGRGAAPEAGEAGAGCQFYRDQLLRKGVAHAAHMGSFSTNIALHSQEQIVLRGVSRGGVAVETDSRWRCVLPDDNHDVLEFCCTPRSKNCYHLQLLYHLQPRSQ
ncbi:protein SFI1 homolog isoform X3 [Salvelinus alpinus]